MGDLKKCSRPGCNPVEQIRGEMGPGDYADVAAAHGLEYRGDGPTHRTEDHYKYVELDDVNRGDFRICCLTCGKATGWNQKDAPGAPGAVADYVRRRWNEVI